MGTTILRALSPHPPKNKPG